jgi:uncharacterized membrane protein
LSSLHIDTQSFNNAFDALKTSINKPGQQGNMQPYVGAALIGVVAGLRSTMPLALLAWEKGSQPGNAGTLSHLLDIPVVKVATGLAAVGEVIADKMPSIPGRLNQGPFMARLVSGALAGMFITSQARRSPALGAVLGAAGAGLGSYTGYSYRIVLPATTHIADFLWAVVEDITAFSLGSYAVQKNHAE